MGKRDRDELDAERAFYEELYASVGVEALDAARRRAWRALPASVEGPDDEDGEAEGREIVRSGAEAPEGA